MNDFATFQSVCDVTRAETLLPEGSGREAVEALVRWHVEACSGHDDQNVVTAQLHPLIAAVHFAFCDHRPLALSPDMFWLLIVQGLAQHINANPEEMRSHFVQHDGKVTLQVRRDDFVKGCADNPWPEVFEAFSTQIRAHIGDENHEHIVVPFSTTGAVERAANEVALMGALKSYFEYELMTLCGIPEVWLEGTAQDWDDLAFHAQWIGETYGLDWCTQHIVPRLKRIARNAHGADDPELWRDIYKYHDGSGGPHITGWILDFLPYVQRSLYRHKKSGELVQWPGRNVSSFEKVKVSVPNDHRSRARGITTDILPSGLCTAPFKWLYLNRTFEMSFVAGFMGMTQDSADFTVRPRIGWAVCQP